MTRTSESASIARSMAGWRLTGIGLLRITFGGVWAIDAWFKWQPSDWDYQLAMARISNGSAMYVWRLK